MRVKLIMEYQGEITEGLGHVSDDPADVDHDNHKTYTTLLSDEADCSGLLDDIKNLYRQIKYKHGVK